MPSTSQEMLDWMSNYHGPEFKMDSTAIAFLEEKGYVLTRDWQWIPPKGITLQTMPQDDYMHLLYLVQEWDFGGLCE